MLFDRVLTALALQGVLITTLFAFDYLDWFVVALFGVFAMVVWEWSSLIGFRGGPMRLLYSLIMLLLFSLFGLSIEFLDAYWVVLLPSILSWFWYIRWLQDYPRTGMWGRYKSPRLMHSMIICIGGMYGLLALVAEGVPRGSWLIFALAMAVASADVGAYFAGKWWGKTPLMPEVSPNKTMGGVIGGAVTSAFISALFAWGWWHYTGELRNAILLMIALVVAIPFSVGGDLLISMFKRHMGVKDTGSVLPGHGGFLDRLDGMVAAVPPVAAFLLITGLA